MAIRMTGQLQREGGHRKLFYAEASVQNPLDPSVHNSLLDYLLTAVISIISTLGTIAWYFVRKQMRAYDEHMRDAATDTNRLTRLEEQSVAHRQEDELKFTSMDKSLEKIEDTHDGLNRTLRWVGDCMIMLGSKQGVKLPPRPE